MLKIPLAAGWEFKERDPARAIADDFAAGAGWLPATVPGVVQGDLLAQGLIPDPFQELNETAVQWVGERDWIYRCRFSWTPMKPLTASRSCASAGSIRLRPPGSTGSRS